MRDFIKKRLDPEQRYGLRLTLFVLAISIVAVPFGLILDQVVRNGPLVRVDTAAANNLHELVRHSAIAVSILKIISFLGSPPWFWVIVGGIALNFWLRGGRRIPIYLLTTSVLGGVVDTIVKYGVNRDRPSLESPVAEAFGKSFPSGHSMISTIVYGSLVLVFIPLIRANWGRIATALGAVVLVLSIGFSRLALGVHYISDVLGGIFLGLAWLTASTAAFSAWRKDTGKKPVEPLEGVEPAETKRVAKEMSRT